MRTFGRFDEVAARDAAEQKVLPATTVKNCLRFTIGIPGYDHAARWGLSPGFQVLLRSDANSSAKPSHHGNDRTINQRQDAPALQSAEPG